MTEARDNMVGQVDVCSLSYHRKPSEYPYLWPVLPTTKALQMSMVCATNQNHIDVHGSCFC